MVELESKIKNGIDEKKYVKQVPTKCDSYDQPVPPDGGWGWAVVFASFMIHVVTDGVVYSFGEFFKVFLDKYKAGAGMTSLIPSILVGTTLCSGPVASIFVNKFGCRPVTIAGSIISALCIVISIFATNVSMLIITIGFGAGVGFGLIYLPAIVSVTCWFEKYRAVATGIGVCGSGFGTILFAPLIRICIANIGLEGTLLMIAGSVLTCVIYGMFLRPVPIGKPCVPHVKEIAIYSPENVPLTTTTVPADDVFRNGGTDGNRRYSVHDVSELSAHNEKLNSNSGSQFVSQPTLAGQDVRLNKSCLSLSNHSNILMRKDIFFTGSTRSIRDMPKSNGHIHTSQKHMNNIRKISTEKKSYNCLPCSSIECQDTISEMTDFSLLRDIVFVVFVISNFLTSIGFNLPYIYIPEQITNKGYPSETSSYLLSAIGLGNTAGRIILGYASDKPKVNRLFVYNTCLTICGFTCILSVFCETLSQNVLYAVTFGFTTGAYVGLTSVITVDLFGLDKLTNAFGLLLLFQGIASFIGPPLAGFLCDRLSPGNYDLAFYISGSTIGISGLMLYCIPSIQRCLDRRK